MNKGPVSQFIEKHYLHFNAAALVDAAKGYETHLTDGGKMMITLAGAMSTAELGKSLAEMIRQNKVANLPVKAKKMATKIRYFNYFIFGNGQQIWLQKRGAGDIWQDLHQFPMIETEAACEVADLAQNPEWQLFFGESQLRIESVFVATQQLTHQTIKAKFYTVENNFTNILPKNNAYFLIKPKNIANFALPKIITTYFENRTLSLF